jgi:hypothetical protein
VLVRSGEGGCPSVEVAVRLHSVRDSDRRRNAEAVKRCGGIGAHEVELAWVPSRSFGGPLWRTEALDSPNPLVLLDEPVQPAEAGEVDASPVGHDG